MITPEQTRNAVILFQQGRSDRDVERLTGLTPLQILELRAAVATAPARKRLLQSGSPPS